MKISRIRLSDKTSRLIIRSVDKVNQHVRDDCVRDAADNGHVHGVSDVPRSKSLH
jgi:hypothetical protein